MSQQISPFLQTILLQSQADKFFNKELSVKKLNNFTKMHTPDLQDFKKALELDSASAVKILMSSPKLNGEQKKEAASYIAQEIFRDPFVGNERSAILKELLPFNPTIEQASIVRIQDSLKSMNNEQSQRRFKDGKSLPVTSPHQKLQEILLVINSPDKSQQLKMK